MNKKRIESILDSYVAMFMSSRQQNRKNGRQNYLDTVLETAGLIRRSAELGDFEEGLRILQSTQEYDLQYLAKNESDREKSNATKENIACGECHYRTLKNHSDIYRVHVAPGFVRGDRVKGVLPKDGMQKALASHLRHMGARHSLLLPHEEAELVAALVALIEVMIRRYTEMQEEVVVPANGANGY